MSESSSHSKGRLIANLLGSIQAENDGEMLSKGFYESRDFKTLLEGRDRPVVVGRRGTGKSALALELQERWGRDKATRTLLLQLEEDQVLGLRRILEPFGAGYNHFRAASKLFWRYTILAETAVCLASHYKVKGDACFAELERHAKAWRRERRGVTSRMYRRLGKLFTEQLMKEGNIAEIAPSLGITELEQAVKAALRVAKKRVVLLIDKLDEGYEPDDVGIGFVGGAILACSEINATVTLHSSATDCIGSGGSWPVVR